MRATSRSPIPSTPERARLGLRAAVALLVVLVVAVGLVGGDFASAQTAPKPDPLADADRTVEQLRRQADAASASYFTELARFETLDREVNDLETKIPLLQQRAQKLRAQVQERAVAAYERSSSQMAAIIDSTDTLDFARRTKLLGRLNAHDDAVFQALNTSLADLSAQRAQLRTARQSEADSLEQVRKQGESINATLTAAVNRQRSLQAAAAAATAAAATTTTTTVARQAAPATRPARSGAPPAPSTPPAAPPTYTPTAGVHPHHDDPFLVCTRNRESGGRYSAFNPAGPYLGAYQFLQATWNGAANHAGRPDLIGVPANAASPYDQDDVAWALYQWQGKGPWGGAC